MEAPGTRSSTAENRRAVFEAAVRVIAVEHHRDLTIDEVARRARTSRRQLQRAFAEVGRTTFRDHLRQVRMATAAELLAGAPLTVAQVMRACGYRQPAQFAKAFQRETGMSPSAYRRQRARQAGDWKYGVPSATTRSTRAFARLGG